MKHFKVTVITGKDPAFTLSGYKSMKEAEDEAQRLMDADETGETVAYASTHIKY